MKELELNVIPLKGLGALYFGMSVEEMTQIMGESTEVEDITDEDDFSTTILNYNDLGISIFFEGVDAPVLACIETDNTNCMLFGQKVFTLSEARIIELMNENGFSDMDIDDEEWGEHRVSFEDGLIDFYFREGELTTINWGVLINDQGDVEAL
ncbi:MAG: hypothetical protein EOL88_05680 [Bacteroidia bacterium]|nr:hypothetical protein [Bacteroidales bacterium]NCD41565.1 hypothetical protein [Bacteroidia bacterium]MDD2322336.1 hypothetical protein [Bacteroidales bacterium]MDD3009878.1 hypothetical protein [Bacteroidales bacterium]MDD3961475.1 hypothetical protein [Bacteroidales bacterium]